MKAIQTKYIPATETKPSRIKATAEGGNSLTITYDHSGNEHETAALALVAKMGWGKGCRLVGGGLPDGSMAWVFVETHPALVELAKVRERFQAGERGGEVMGVISKAMDLGASHDNGL
jgi:hypothetical protein